MKPKITHLHLYSRHHPFFEPGAPIVAIQRKAWISKMSTIHELQNKKQPGLVTHADPVGFLNGVFSIREKRIFLHPPVYQKYSKSLTNK